MKDILLYENVPSLKNNFTVKFMQFLNNKYLIPHWHEHLELIYIYSGSCTFTVNGDSFTAAKNDFIVVNSTEIHSFNTNEHIDYFCILIYPDFFSDVDFSNILLKTVIHADDYIKSCFNEIYYEYNNNTKGSDMMLKSHTYRLMAYLMRSYTVSTLSDKDFGLRTIKLRRINLLLEYISEHYTEKITTAQLAGMCYLSESHFCRFFKGIVGKSATEYINEYRIEKATVMLKTLMKALQKLPYE